MNSPHSLDLTWAAPSEFSGPFYSLARPTQRYDTLVSGSISTTTDVFACGFGELDALALPLAPRLIVIAGHLQCQLQ